MQVTPAITHSVAGQNPSRAEIRRYITSCDFDIDARTGEVIAHGTVDLTAAIPGPTLPFRFKSVAGDLILAKNQLTSLLGCPRRMQGVLDCSDNFLRSLEGAPLVCDPTSIEALRGNSAPHLDALAEIDCGICPEVTWTHALQVDRVFTLPISEVLKVYGYKRAADIVVAMLDTDETFIVDRLKALAKAQVQASQSNKPYTK